MNIHKAILYGEDFLGQRGVIDPGWNAERLLLLATKLDRAQLYADLNREIAAEEAQTYEQLLQKRSEHYPLAYLEGTQEFYGRSFIVDQSVLIPRPETEEIVRCALDLPLPPFPSIIDLGAGSGCIGVILAHEIADATVVALEYSADALLILKKNADQRIAIVRGNLYATPFLPESFDVVVANPPYVEQGRIESLPAETRWEPRIALVTESLENTYHLLFGQSLRILRPGGYLLFEIGFGQKERIQTVVEAEKSFREVGIRNDLQAIPRTFVLEKIS